MVCVDVLTFAFDPAGKWPRSVYDCFLGSLRDTGHSGHVHLVTQPRNEFAEAVSRDYPGTRVVVDDMQFSRWQSHMPLNNRRWFSYLKYLRGSGALGGD